MVTTTVIFDCPVTPWLVGGAGAAAVTAAIAFLHCDAAHLARLRRVAILATVLVAGTMLVGLALGPTLIRTWEDPEKPRCAVLLDGSRSMLLADDYSGAEADWLLRRTGSGVTQATRRDVVRLLLEGGAEAWPAAVARQFDVSAWRFATSLEAVAIGDAEAPFDVDPEGYATALGDALAEVGSGSGGRPPQAVILLSDGAWNTGRDPHEVARRLGQLGAPVFVVGVGDPTPPRDVRVLDLRGPKTALLGDEVLLTARIAGAGLGAVRLPVELTNGGKGVERKDVSVPPSGQPVTVNFTFVPEAPGRLAFQVRVPPQEGERDVSNNQAAVAVDVDERKIRVLLIDGEPRWEFRFLRNVLERDPAVALTVCLLRPGVGPIAGEGYLAELPTENRGLADYDLVILGDVPGDKMPEGFLKALSDMVRQRSGSLVVVAGRGEHYRRLAGTPVASILPVMLEDVDAGAGEKTSEPFRPELTQDGLTGLVTRLASSTEENDSAWSRLPRIQWSAGVGALAPGASALLVHPYRLAGVEKMPLLAVHRVGEGKVMFLGLEETWRWRKVVGDEFHYRFWAQAVRWMTKRPFSDGDPRTRISIDRTACDVGETARVEVYCLGPDGFPLQGGAVWLKVTDGEGRSDQVAAPAAPGGWGVYRAAFKPARPGTYRMQPIVSAYGDQPLPPTVSLTVARVDLEKDLLAQNLAALKAVAEASGGRYLTVAEADQLPAILAARKQPRMITDEYSPCRHWAYYTVLAVLLGAAWLIRKRSGLA